MSVIAIIRDPQAMMDCMDGKGQGSLALTPVLYCYSHRTILLKYGGNMKKSLFMLILFLSAAMFIPLELVAQVIKPQTRDDVLTQPLDTTAAANKISVVNTYTLSVQKRQPLHVILKRLDNGSFFTAWQEWLVNDKFAGIGTFWTDTMQSTGHAVHYTDLMGEFFIQTNAVVPFSDGNVLVVYENKLDHKVRCVILNETNQIHKEPLLINDGAAATKISVTRLPGGKTALIGFYTLAGTVAGFGKFTIVNSSGDIVAAPKSFSTGRIDDLQAVTLGNGLVLLVYVSGMGESIVIDQTGNIIRAKTRFHPNAASSINAVPLDNGNVLIAFRDQFEKPRYQIIDATGKPTGAFVTMFDGTVDAVRALRLNNGNILVAFTRLVNLYSTGLGLVILDQTGKVVKNLQWFLEGLELPMGNFDLTAVKENLAMIVYGGYWPQGSGQTGYKNGFLLVK
jgi:hypothetical protein